MSEITSPRTRVLTLGVDGQEPFLTLVMAFGPDLTDAGIDALAEQIAAPARRVLGVDADDIAAPPMALNEADRHFLDFALDQAAEEKSLGDGFTDADRASLTKLRRLAEGGAR